MAAVLLHFAGLLVVLTFLAPGVQAQQVLDRIAVTVNNQVITESDLIRYLRVAAFLDRKPLDLSPEAKRAAASSLVDQDLMMADAAESHFVLPAAKDVPVLLEQVRAQYPSDAAYQDALKQYGLTEQDLADRLLAAARAIRFPELRFQPEIQITDAELRMAYDQQVDQWQASHTGAPPSFDASRADLEKLLTNQKTMQSLDQWLATARMQNNVEYREAAFR